MKMTRLRMPIAVMAVMVSIVFSSRSGAVHTGGDVPLKDANGDPVTSSTPYSPKATCGECHNYGSGDKFSTHVQGVLESDNKVYWQAYQTKSFEHGVSVGRHSNQGRNEDYNNAFRSAAGDPFFTSSPGMFGKY
jgi:hypothetical protein